MPQEQRFWNLIALGVYVMLVAICVVLVARYGDLEIDAIGFFDLTVMGLATFRLVHLLTYDKIFETVRAAFMDSRGGRLKKAARGWRRLMCEFLECIWCTGMWSGLFVVTAYLLDGWGRFAALVLAVAGIGSLFQVISKTIAERR
jgi:uncharacterized protein DUF1360